MLGNLAQFNLTANPAEMSDYDAQPMVNIYASVQGRDLGGLQDDVNKIVDQFRSKLPRGTDIEIRGQAETMNSSFIGLGGGLLVAILLVYLLIVVNFQSWLDPFIIITALPAALAGILWMLLVTRTTLSVPSSHRHHHGHGRGHVQQHFDGVFRARAIARREKLARSRACKPAISASAP